MSKYIIQGGTPLRGEVFVQGAKNSVLPILAATILAKGKSVVHNCPDIRDVALTIEILKGLGCKVEREGNTVIVDSTDMTNDYIPQSLMNKMRSSVIFMGAILARMQAAKCSYPGGCELGARPINLHLKSFRRLGVHIKEEEGYISCHITKFKPDKINLDFPSVGATENIMLLACRHPGTTTVINAAREPEIVDLQNFLNGMGAKISGAGSSCIEIHGVEQMYPVERSVIPDRIMAATMLFMAAATKGELTLRNVEVAHIDSIVSVLAECGAQIHVGNDFLTIACPNRLKAIDTIQTMPYPGFPTDAQSPLIAALATMEGTAIVKETIFDSRFKTATELLKMGADITVNDHVAVIRGVEKLHNAGMEAPDLRGGASLVIAALGAEGKSEINNVHFIDRGYEKFEQVIQKIGGTIQRV